MNIKVGTKVTGHWGAMIADSEGIIVSINDPEPNRLLPNYGREVEIYWDNETELDFCHENSIHEKGYRSPNGSPIGIFIK